MINLNNYEEYFLLYIDKELSKEQCEAVEAFVHQHPHLATELDMLNEAKLPAADATVYSNKSSLYKAADGSININNYEEYFLLHTDNELSTRQEEEVEQFVLQHPQLQEEFLLLQEAKLVPEIIECPDKHRLYKQPARRVIPLYITRMAVAAAVAGVVVLIGSFFINNNDNYTPIASKVTKNKAVEQSATPEKQLNVTLPENKQTEVVVAQKESRKSEQVPVKTAKVINNKPVVLPESKESNKEPLIVQIDPMPVAQQTVPAPEDVITSNNTAPKQEKLSGLKPLEEINENESASSVMYVSNDVALAKPAIYKELNTDEEDQTLYVGSLQLNKAKVNGLVKKVTHLLGTKNKESNL